YWQRQGDDDALVLERLLLRAAKGEVEAVRPQLQARIDQGGPAAPLAREALVTGLLYRFHLGAADQHLERWLQAEPDNTLALGLPKRGDEARAVLDECLRSNPDHAPALAERGRLALRDGDGPRAEELLRRAIDLDPGLFPAHYQYSLALQGNRKDAEAVQEQ